jgi:multimeric flavodoxin WrbA
VEDAQEIKMKEADGIILGSPVHYSDIAGTMKLFLDRAFYVASSNYGMFIHKVGASVVAVRKSGGIPTFDQLNNYIDILWKITYNKIILMKGMVFKNMNN